ncbi:MAG TPA: arylesterase [Terriglobales bacterium]|jgi:acyl-CoA thioesterase-1
MQWFRRAAWVIAWLAVAAAGQTAAPLIIAFGDSLTAGAGVPQSASYPADLARLMAQAHSPYRVINRGVSGDTTTDALQRLPAVISLHPRWVLLEFGGNDGLRGLPLSTTRAHLQSMIAALQKAGIHILLVGMTLPPNYGAPYVRAFQDIFPSLAAQDHLPLLPVLYQDLIPRLRTDPGLLQDDGIHASVRGNAVVAETVWHALRPLLKK